MNRQDLSAEAGWVIAVAVLGAAILRDREGGHGWELAWRLPLYACMSVVLVGAIAIPVGYLLYRLRKH